MIDEEIRDIIEISEQAARKVLTDHIDDLHKLARALLEYETLNGKEVEAVLRGESIHRGDDDAPPNERAPASTVPASGKTKDRGPRGGLEPEPQPGA
jgi:cell division protease FtsH